MKTLTHLIKELNTEIKDKGIDNALDLLSPFTKYQGDDWKSIFKVDKTEFQYSVLHKDENLKLVLIYWNAFRKSEKHGHMKGGGLMKVLEGKVIETRFDPDDNEKVVGNFCYSTGDLSYIHDALAYHVVENQSNIPAISLHLYCSGAHSNFGF
jgi:hypothetical protein